MALDNVHPEVYSFLSWLNVDITAVQTTFFGADLLTPNNILLTAVACVLMYLQMKTTTLVKPTTPKIPGM